MPAPCSVGGLWVEPPVFHVKHPAPTGMKFYGPLFAALAWEWLNSCETGSVRVLHIVPICRRIDFFKVLLKRIGRNLNDFF